jgi:multidrug efflux pump subunit AcrB
MNLTNIPDRMLSWVIEHRWTVAGVAVIIDVLILLMVVICLTR